MIAFFRNLRASFDRLARAADMFPALAETQRCEIARLTAINQELTLANGHLVNDISDKAAKILVLESDLDRQKHYVHLQFVAYGRQEREYFQLATERNRLRRLAHQLIEHMGLMGINPPLTQEDARLLAAPSFQITKP